MDETLKAPESSDSRRWIGRILMAVVLGEALWGFLVSITNNLALPAMARVVGGDAQSPLYLGKGDFNVPALFASVLELCFAGILVVLLSARSQKSGRSQVRQVRVAPIAAGPLAPVVALAPTAVPEPSAESRVTSVVEPGVRAKAPVTSEPSAPPLDLPAPQPTKAAKPKRPKQVYYNIVGEPVETEDE